MQNILSVVVLVVYNVAGQNNVCSTYKGYVDLNSKDCWHDADIGATWLEIIQNNGYDAETYSIYTEDGYILSVHRVISNKMSSNGQVLLLYHGFLIDSKFWTSWRKKSIAFILSDLGYDVWLADARGTQNSRGHINESISPADYWNFSFHEMGYYDLPATLEVINNKTLSNEIIYIGHSMGTTISFIYGSLKPNHLKKYVKSIIALCPIAFLGHLTSSLGLAAPFVDIFGQIFPDTNTYSINEDLSYSKKNINFCSKGLTIKFCVVAIMSVAGFDYEQMTPDVPIKLLNMVSSISSKTAVHFSQLVEAKDRFQQFDYGPVKNLERYNNSLPPIYDVTAIPIPIRMFYGKADKLSAEADVQRLMDTLHNNDVSMNAIPFNSSIKYSHIDFQSARDNFHLFITTLIKEIKILSRYN